MGLMVSTLEPRKNANFVIDWFRSSELLPDGTELWWVGRIGWPKSPRLLQDLQRGHKGRRIRLLGVVSDQQLCELYQTVGWSVYPSLYEGFGFPVLDSLRHGVPVLSSCNSSLREFAHPGVHFFDPHDAATLDQAWTDVPGRGAELGQQGATGRTLQLGSGRPGDPGHGPRRSVRRVLAFPLEGTSGAQP